MHQRPPNIHEPIPRTIATMFRGQSHNVIRHKWALCYETCHLILNKNMNKWTLSLDYETVKDWIC